MPRPKPTLEHSAGTGGAKGGAEADEVLLGQALRHAEQHLNEPEDDAQRTAAVEELRQWLQTQPQLNARTGQSSAKVSILMGKHRERLLCHANGPFP